MSEKKEVNLLKELCGDDVKLYDFLNGYLYLNPLLAISEKSLDILTEEAEKSGNFRDVVGKTIFEGSQKPGERERYVRIIQDLASKIIIHTREQEEKQVEKEGLVDQAASRGRLIENQKFMSERAEDIINVASKFYNERLVEFGENIRREERLQKISAADYQERRTGREEKAQRKEREKERSGMGKEEKKEAERQDKIDELAARERKKARGEERKEAVVEEKRIGEQEEAGREERKKERSGN